MAAGLGAWLRRQREARGWTRPELARLLIQAGHAKGDRSMPGPDSVCHNIYRWERGADLPSERYQHCYCRVFGIPLSQFGPAREAAAPGAATLGETALGETASAWPAAPAFSPGSAISALAGPPLPIPAPVAYRGEREPDPGSWLVQREVLMAAHEGSDHAEEAEAHGIGEATFEQLRADVVRLAHLTDTGEPFPVLLDLRRVRARIYRLLDRRLWPREQTDLYFLLGCLNGLMGVTANRLGYPDAAEELIRAGWAYAVAIDHRPLLAQLRYEQSYVEYWRGRTLESRDLAASGLQYLSDGPGGAELHLHYARAAATLGDAEAARRAVAAAHDARDREHHDELLEIGGEFAMSRATHHCFAGAALAEVDGAEAEAGRELERAISSYDAGPGPGEEHWFGGKALASTDLAAIHLRAGALDAAAATLETVLRLSPARRINVLATRLGLVRAELAAPVFRGSVQARELDERIEDFSRDTITAGLHSLPGGP
jgi:transcriptional regulator with XRE-family HTH domain/tetratricopeptide (TPR) repeat protein